MRSRFFGLPSSSNTPRHARRAGGFTLVEVLVVVAIVSILVAILMPALKKARHHAAVLASPIAYLGADSRVHLTDASGALDTPVAIVARNYNNCPVCHTPPVWNPAGTKIAFRTMDRGLVATALIDPFSGQVQKHRNPGREFLGWLDSGSFVEVDRGPGMLYVRDAHSGVELAGVPNAAGAVSVSAAPAGAAAPFVGSGKRRGVASVMLLRKDLGQGRRLWQAPLGGAESFEGARMDPTGEFVAWTGTSSAGKSIQFKGVNDAPAQLPADIRGAYQSVYFCDWTEEGTLLGNATRDGRTWTLVIFDRRGRLVREIRTDTPPAEGPIASWRKYGRL